MPSAIPRDNTSPLDLATLVDQARTMIENRQFLGALETLQVVLEAHPTQGQAQRLYNQIVYGPEYPERVIVEPTNFCAMNCPMCSGRGGKVGFMPHSKFSKLMEEIGPRLNEIWLHQRGDPFYHREIYDFIDTVGEYNLKCIMHTHGSHQLDCERLAATKTRLELVFSVDGASQEGLSHYRTRADFDLILHNIKRILALRRKLKKEFPRIVWKFIVMKPNEHEMEQAEKLAKKIGIDRFTFSEFGINWTSFDLPGFKESLAKLIPTDKRYFHEDYEATMRGIIKRRVEQIPHCFHINLVKPTIRWNGDLIPCCMCIPPHENVIGNVFEEDSFLDLWNSKRYRAFRKQAVLAPKSLTPCDRCAIIF